MDRIEVGLHVDIQRSDGRVHGAVVSDLKRDKGVVIVEWFEKGETKGKEIDLPQLLKINPTLIGMGKSNLSQILSESHQHVNDADLDLEETLYIPPPSNNAPKTRRTIHSSAPAVVAAPALVRNSIQLKPKTTTAGSKLQAPTPVVPTANITSRKSRPAISPDSTPILSSILMSGSTERMDENEREGRKKIGTRVLKKKKEQDEEKKTMEQEVEDMDETRLLDGKGGKSNTVQEIEKLQKNREERRAQQEREKKKKEMEKSIDPGNANYQFLMMIREYQSQIDYRPLRMSDPVAENRITVCVRKRPLNKKEMNRKEIEVITIPNKDHLIVHQPQVKVDLTKYLENQKFRFDYSFDENANNEMVYKFTAQPLVKTIFEQGFATCFAYGQTGSGKTHTMGGDMQGKTQNCAEGIYALTAADVFRLLNREYKRENLTVGCSFFEIYGGKVYDLLSNKSILRVLEDGKSQVQVVGLAEQTVSTEAEVLELIRKGTEVRTAGSTSANANSSRSHAVFQIILRKKQKLHGKFSLIDLAGNERGVDTAASDRQTRLEGAEINKSLLSLKGTGKEALDLQRAISSMTAAEEQVLIDLRLYFDDEKQELRERSVLKKKTDNPDYDVEEVARDLRAQLEKEIEMRQAALQNVRKWQKAINQEAEISAKQKAGRRK